MKRTASFQGRTRHVRDIAIILMLGFAVFLSACGSSDGKSDVDSGPCPSGQNKCAQDARPMDSTLDVAKDMTDAWVAPDLAKDAVDALGEIGLDSGACPVGQVRYESPGCGVEVKPVCGSSEQDACFRPVCSCQGKTISRCDYATEPFLSFGACPASDSGIDLPPDGVAVDLAVDLPVDIAQDVGLDGSVDGVLDSSVDVAYDAGPCPSGQVFRYESPGCDAEAKPVCGSRSQDACYRAVCSCKGVTISRCDYASEPFAAFGACSGTDGGPG